MEKIVMLGKRLALKRPEKLPDFQPGQFSTELETEAAVGVIQYVGYDVVTNSLNSVGAIVGLLKGTKVYYHLAKSEQIRMKGQDLVIVFEEDIIALVEETDD